MSAPLNNAVRERVEGTRRIDETAGWEWIVDPEAFGHEEPCIADTDLAPKLGLVVKDQSSTTTRCSPTSCTG